MTDTAFILPDEPLLLGTPAANLWNRLLGKGRGEAVPAQPAYLALARTGNEGALAALYADYREPVWRLCRRLTRSEADAEDVLQTTFVKAFAALPRFRGDASVKTWLFRIAVNEANTARRIRETVGEPDAETPAPRTLSDMRSESRFADLWTP